MCIPHPFWTPEIGRANTEHRRKNEELRALAERAMNTPADIEPTIEDAIWQEIPQIAPLVAEDQV
ncbi:MAG TPA: hypothetical protein VIU82_00250 [Bosea sp. (in: a-proteobacteria)]